MRSPSYRCAVCYKGFTARLISWRVVGENAASSDLSRELVASCSGRPDVRPNARWCPGGTDASTNNALTLRAAANRRMRGFGGGMAHQDDDESAMMLTAVGFRYDSGRVSLQRGRPLLGPQRAGALIDNRTVAAHDTDWLAHWITGK